MCIRDRSARGDIFASVFKQGCASKFVKAQELLGWVIAATDLEAVMQQPSTFSSPAQSEMA
eukprot:3818396-Rhodomonas_salina.1